MEAAQVVLEEVMRAAILSAQRAAARAAAGDRHSAGQVFAYHDMLDVLKSQAEIAGITFEDALVAGFNPDDLISLSAPRKAA